MSLASRPDRRDASRAMGASAIAALSVLAVLLVAGWGDTAWAVAVSVLLLACLLACLVTTLADRRACAELDRALERLRAGRRNPARPR